MDANKSWPSWSRIHIANANIPADLLGDRSVADVGVDGLCKVDLIVDDGKIADVVAAGAPFAGPVYDVDAGIVLPPFADLHTHLDKGQIWPRARNHDGTLETARAQTRADTIANWRSEDVEARFEFSLRCAYANGSNAIRTHIDCLVPGQANISFGVFRRLREKWAGRITLQAVALVSTDLYDTPENAEVVDIVAESGGRLGGITFRLSELDDPRVLDARLDRLFALASARGLDVDLHVDENGSASSNTLAQIAQAVLRNSFQGQVVCGHCCSLAVQDEAVVSRTIDAVKEAGIKIVSLPLVNQYLQGRISNETPRWRGIPLLRELLAAGVPVSLASDNCRDAYHAFGDMDLLDVLGGAVRIGHLEGNMGSWSAAITKTPASIIDAPGRGMIKSGVPADFQIFSGRTFSELLTRHAPNRVVVRGGRAIAERLPDFRELDHLMKADAAR